MNGTCNMNMCIQILLCYQFDGWVQLYCGARHFFETLSENEEHQSARM